MAEILRIWRCAPIIVRPLLHDGAATHTKKEMSHEEAVRGHPDQVTGPGGSVVEDRTCQLEYWYTTSSSILIVWGNIVIFVASGETVCNYGVCGEVSSSYAGGIVVIF